MKPMNDQTIENPAEKSLNERVIEFIEAAGSISGYGFHRPENPNDFFPDPEGSSAEEIAAHKAACEAWNRGEYKRDPSEESGWHGNMHILKAPWGIGSYSYLSDEAKELIAELKGAQ